MQHLNKKDPYNILHITYNFHHNAIKYKAILYTYQMHAIIACKKQMPVSLTTFLKSKTLN